MTPFARLLAGISFLAFAVPCFAGARDPQTPAQRGKEALLTKAYSYSAVPRKGFDSLWKQWGLTEKPADFPAGLSEHYGLHPAPYPNDSLPMGLRPVADAQGPGVALDCMLCHGGSLFGKSYVGLPNTSLDLAALFQDFATARGFPQMLPYRLSNVRGTTESTATAIFLIAFRDPDLNVKMPTSFPVVPDQMCEDPPAWWLLKKKKTMYHNGRLDARAVRPLMSFMMSPMTSGAQFRKLEPTFADIRQYLLTVEPPKYPFPIKADLVAQGRVLFEDTCAQCHGSAKREYPNKIVPLEKIGTDPMMVRSLNAQVESDYRQSWFAREPGPDGKPFRVRESGGYQAPPLDGIWATAPYFHNGSVPTLAAVLDSKSRPILFTRSFKTGTEDYDTERVGWKTTELKSAPDSTISADQRRRIYDTSQPGRSNSGHTFGDDLTDPERKAVIEYLKTL
jgi:hypothetical protein